MELLEFKDYATYVKAQKRTVGKRGIGPYFTDLQMDSIAAWMYLRGKRVDNGICHGARDGLEVREFQRVFPTAAFFGTDLFPYSSRIERDKCFKKKHPVIAHDFSEVSEEWVGKFDLVYSNSLDHARDPVKAMNTWIGQLNQNGYLFLVWDKAYVLAKGGDCFGASLYEYMELANQVGVLHDLLYVSILHIPWEICKRKRETRRRGTEAVVLVIGKK